MLAQGPPPQHPAGEPGGLVFNLAYGIQGEVIRVNESVVVVLGSLEALEGPARYDLGPGGVVRGHPGVLRLQRRRQPCAEGTG